MAHLGDQLLSHLPQCLPIFLERLKNEITRLTAVKALIRIASSELKIDLKVRKVSRLSKLDKTI